MLLDFKDFHQDSQRSGTFSRVSGVMLELFDILELFGSYISNFDMIQFFAFIAVCRLSLFYECLNMAQSDLLISVRGLRSALAMG